MKLSTLWSMLGGTAAPFTLRVLGLLKPVHRVAWLAAACKHDVVGRLRERPMTLVELAAALGAAPERHAALEAWLTHGCLLGELRRDGERYHLRGFARRLAEPRFRELNAFVIGLAEIHHRGIYEALDHLDDGRSLAELDHSLVARVSEVTAPVLREVIDRHVPATGDAALLELGCGHGRHLRHACDRNPALSAVGVELDPSVAETAREQLSDAGLAERARIETGDLRSVALDERFDVVTLFNLVYYFPLDDRPAMLARVASWLAPGGTLLLTTMARGGTMPANVLDIWFASFRECGPLPVPAELVAALEDAGLEVNRPVRLLPGEQYWLFVARRPATKQLRA